MSGELSTGKTIFILAVVVGCFAVLWPKVFYPMLTASVKQSGSIQVPYWKDPGNAHAFDQLCFLLEEQQDPTSSLSRMSDQMCIDYVRKSCGVILSERIVENYRQLIDKTNVTDCLQRKFDITLEKVLAAAPPPTRTKPYQPQSVVPHPHARPERPTHLHPESLHPALREKGRTMPQRTIEKQARPGPMPGIRPPMGGGGHMVPPQSKGSGAMGIIMPLYTVGIVIFFVYTIMKVLFKKSDEEDCKAAKLKDFHLDPEYRKYVFAEEYLDSANASHRDLLRRQERESSKQRRRPEPTVQPDTKIEDEQMDQLRRRLEETEKAMERLMSQMGSVTDKLTAAKITEVLSQAQTQARILKEQESLRKRSSLDGQEAELNHKVEETGSSISTPTDSTIIEKEARTSNCDIRSDKNLEQKGVIKNDLEHNDEDEEKDVHETEEKQASEEEEDCEEEEVEEEGDEECESEEAKINDKNINVSGVKSKIDEEKKLVSAKEIELEKEEYEDEDEEEEEEEIDEKKETIEKRITNPIKAQNVVADIDYEEEEQEDEQEEEQEEELEEEEEEEEHVNTNLVKSPPLSKEEEKISVARSMERNSTVTSSASNTERNNTVTPSASCGVVEGRSSPQDAKARIQDK